LKDCEGESVSSLEKLGHDFRYSVGHDFVGQVGVAVGHGAGTVTEQLADHLERHAAHGQVAGGAVTQVVPVEVRDPRSLQGVREGKADVEGLFPVVGGEYKGCVDPADSPQGSQLFQGAADERHTPALLVLRDPQGNPAAIQVHLVPGQAELLTQAHAGSDGKQDGRVKISAVALPAGLQECPQLIVGQVSHPAGIHARLVHRTDRRILQPAPLPHRHGEHVAQGHQVMPSGCGRDAAPPQGQPPAGFAAGAFQEELVPAFDDQGRRDLVQGVLPDLGAPPVEAGRDRGDAALGLSGEYIFLVAGDGIGQGVPGGFVPGKVAPLLHGRLSGHGPLAGIGQPGEGGALRRESLLADLDLKGDAAVSGNPLPNRRHRSTFPSRFRSHC